MNNISLIVACDINNGIGKNGKMPWGNDLKKDLAFFKIKTQNTNIIMGRKTMESLPKQHLPKRNNIVLSKTKNISNDYIHVFDNIDDALNKRIKNIDTFIIGGESIYKQFMDMSDNIFLTKIYNNFNCDTYFPVIDESEWYIDFESDIIKDGDYDTQYFIYRKK